ncbi:polysaccharide deacetylase family protein [Phytohabitans suffuscus]|uniref:Polysaccharide deacetylase familiy protein n=1 Tax=Phytohabitans suffuscus TaxID=624315 RepID=A0A6F8Z0T0_9ACTN|nr:polysaccharide deacetylase family protein [Phytohabitans suffuscus]BCB91997.1 polysaccharide deacetylase familiy protein [Phytohabitans suffuscus]
MSRVTTGAAAVLTAALATHAGPAATTVAALRRRLLPALSGADRPGHVALTFDDGPDHASTPHFLRALAGAGVRATFFVLGSMLDRDRGLGRQIVADGHELAVHGWEHRNLLWRSPLATRDDIARTRDLVADTAGAPPRWYRPPYGVLTGGAVLTCRRLALRPRLWTAWGREWRPTATPTTILRTVTRDLDRGGTVLLHDSAQAAAPGSWRPTLAVLPHLIDWVRDRDMTLGLLHE